MVKYKNIIDGPRWARIDKAVKKLAWLLDLKCEVIRTTSFLKETVHFTVEGPANQVEKFRVRLNQAVEDYNK